jgi:hypothetical protein
MLSELYSVNLKQSGQLESLGVNGKQRNEWVEEQIFKNYSMFSEDGIQGWAVVHTAVRVEI